MFYSRGKSTALKHFCKCCIFTRATLFPAYSWVLAKRLVGWLVSRVCRASRVCPRAAEGRQARLCVSASPAVRKAGQERRARAECIIQRRFAIRVDSVPSCKLGSARTRPRVLARVFATATCLSVCLSVRLSVRLPHAGIVPSRVKAGS